MALEGLGQGSQLQSVHLLDGGVRLRQDAPTSSVMTLECR
jgi:hypothetical protein